MTEHNQPQPALVGSAAVAVVEVLPSTTTTGRSRAGSAGDLKALHADLTAAYQEYLEMAKIKPSMLSPAMLGLIQQFLRHNEITAEAPQKAEIGALQGRLEQRRKLREIGPADQNRVNLNQTKRA